MPMHSRHNWRASNDVDVDLLSNIEVVQLNYDLTLQRLSAASDWHLC